MSAKQKDFFAEKLKYSIEYGINFDKRIIYVFHELTEDIGTNLRIKYDLLKQWWKQVEEKEFKDITLDIASFGGSIYAITSALDFYDEVLREDGVTVNTKAQTICMSAATILLAGGTGERVATKRCKFMLHDIQVDGMGGTAKQMQSQMTNLSAEQIELFSFYAEFARRGKEPLSKKELEREAKKWLKKYTKDGIDHYISADEALELNLLDRIL